jgi:hypothetical protein
MLTLPSAMQCQGSWAAKSRADRDAQRHFSTVAPQTLQPPMKAASKQTRLDGHRRSRADSSVQSGAPVGEALLGSRNSYAVAHYDVVVSAF